MTDGQVGRQVPYSDIDLQMQLTDPNWGREVPMELKDKLSKIIGYVKDTEGGYEVVKEQMWGLLSFYTRDIRLGNLSHLSGEIGYCKYYLDLANDLLTEAYINSFLICISRVATVLELSQSKQGFLRKIFSTIRQEHYREEIEPPKKGIFGSHKNNRRE